MYNWNTDIRRLKKDPQAYEKWKLEQMINFGLRDEKLSRTLLKKHWESLFIDEAKRNYLKYLLWNTI